MSSGTLQIGAFGVGVVPTFYRMMEGQLLNAFLVPVLGYGLKKLGEQYKVDTIYAIGCSVLFSSVLTLPGGAVGYGICMVGGNTLIAKTIAVAVGAGITYQMFNHTLEL
jgi:hypothetical protein